MFHTPKSTAFTSSCPYLTLLLLLFSCKDPSPFRFQVFFFDDEISPIFTFSYDREAELICLRTVDETHLIESRAPNNVNIVINGNVNADCDVHFLSASKGHGTSITLGFYVNGATCLMTFRCEKEISASQCFRSL